ncbi:hypothetical protein P4O66_013199 [Electrophorus voltai]|uniref:Centrosomal protein of 44 kDa n=1 Tax=Electrophorus voltai TaxID=2609070 RepID=A0AAD8Z606_9TELE|nr:hypothetical protein P4O66_013199 [Electrophorus voltai]
MPRTWSSNGAPSFPQNPDGKAPKGRLKEKIGVEMATGDLKGCLRKLQASLRSLKYPTDVDYQRLAKGDPFCCLPIVSYAFTSFSPALAELLVESGIELTGKNDLSFTESVYKVLRDLFSYKPLLSKQQFLQFGFAERKISLLCDIIGLVVTKHNQLTRGAKWVCTGWGCFEQVVLSRPLVERHLGNNSSARACFSSDTSPQEKRDEAEEEGGGPSAGDGPRPAAHTGFVSECMLKTVEAGLRECVSRMAQLDARLQAVEQSAAGKLVIERSQWENLESRVLLLETSLALISVQGPVKAGGVASLSGFGEKSHLTEETVVLTSAEGPGNSAALGQSESEAGSATHPSTGLPSASPEETIKERLERIANISPSVQLQYQLSCAVGLHAGKCVHVPQ